VSVQEAVENAHSAATGRTGAELASELQDALGQKLVAFAVGDRHPKTIGRYARRERVPDDDVLGRLADLYGIVELLEGGMRREAVRTWMLGSNPHLRGKSPIEVFHDGRVRDVQRAARRFLSRR
jgi:Rv2175c C-terminal domain of unknown function